MDQDVLSAMARWPDVPAAYGWLSLDGRGRWHFHPGGRSAEGGPGESISNTQILAFMDRNYDHDDSGRWFFQNGPQRVYLRLDAAPFIFRYSDDKRSLVSHTGRACGPVLSWWLDDTGRLFAQTDIGPGAIDDRDLMGVLEEMTLLPPHARPADDEDDRALLHAQELTCFKADERARTLGFDPAPSDPVASAATPVLRD